MTFSRNPSLLIERARNANYGRRSSRGPYASGKNAIAICDRSGFKYPWSEMVVEPGTGWLVHRSESDGKYSLVSHPQNFPADVTDYESLPWTRPELVDYESTAPFLIGDSDGTVLVTTNEQYQAIEITTSAGGWHYGYKSYAD